MFYLLRRMRAYSFSTLESSHIFRNENEKKISFIHFMAIHQSDNSKKRTASIANVIKSAKLKIIHIYTFGYKKRGPDIY